MSAIAAATRKSVADATAPSASDTSSSWAMLCWSTKVSSPVFIGVSIPPATAAAVVSLPGAINAYKSSYINMSPIAVVLFAPALMPDTLTACKVAASATLFADSVMAPLAASPFSVASWPPAWQPVASRIRVLKRVRKQVFLSCFFIITI